jgi:hypothetical protein
MLLLLILILLIQVLAMNSKERQESFLKNETQEQKRQRLDKKAERQRNSIKNETQEQRNVRLIQVGTSTKDHRANESLEEHNLRLNQVATSTKVHRANESVEEHNLRLNQVATSTKDRRANESDAEHNLRLNQDVTSTKVRRANESAQEHNRRLNQDATSTKDHRANESLAERNLRLNQVATSTKVRRANESAQEHIDRMNQDTASHAKTRKLTGDKKAAEKADEIANEDYASNFNLPLRDRNAFYKNETFFKDSHNKYNWPKAIAGSWRFGHRRQPGYNSLEFHWSESCDHCGTSYLNGSSNSFRMKCCKFNQNDSCRELQPLIPEIDEVLKRSPNFGRQSHGYNNRLSFGATGVENGKGGKFENKGPVSCVTIAGRLYHFVGNQNSLNLSSGLGYLFFGQPISDSNGDNDNNRLDSGILDYIFEVR